MRNEAWETFREDEFLQLYALLQESFPPAERRPIEAQRALLSQERYHVLVRRDDVGIYAALTYWTLRDTVFIEHFAVSQRYRNKGLGGKLLTSFLSSQQTPVVLETEPPVEKLAVRRVAFYRRHGFHLTEYAYLQPCLTPGEAPVALRLMTYPLRMTRIALEEFQRELYREVYGVSAPV